MSAGGRGAVGLNPANDAPRSSQAPVDEQPMAHVADEPRRGRGRIALSVAALLVLAALVQAYVGQSRVEFLPRPLEVGAGVRLVAFEAPSGKVRPGQRVRVKLFFAGGTPARPLDLNLTPTGFAPEPAQTPTLSHRLIGTHGLRSVSVVLVVPRWLRGPASFRIAGHARPFGEFEVPGRPQQIP